MAALSDVFASEECPSCGQVMDFEMDGGSSADSIELIWYCKECRLVVTAEFRFASGKARDGDVEVELDWEDDITAALDAARGQGNDACQYCHGSGGGYMGGLEPRCPYCRGTGVAR